MISEAVGQVLDAMLENAGRDETVVTFNSDHGDHPGGHLGDHRLLLKDGEHYEQIIRVPLICSDPEARGGTRSDAIAQTVDCPQPSWTAPRSSPVPVCRG